uniref:non-specific serine/threonine protein kinase n=1 Tax=Tetradesmus obliquus TaxID=3088 RepID=A0A383WL17_TETOB|eukprot:jgi/Sobl393_1/8730/SZX78111.1
MHDATCCLMHLRTVASVDLPAVCPPGEQAVGTYLDKCGTCPGSTYKNSTGINLCRPCPVGKAINSSLPADHNSLDDCVCSPGRELAGDACKVCGLNQYKPAAGNEPCTACPAGSLTSGQQPSQHDELADCKCQPGSYMTAAGTCEICPSGTYSSAAGSFECQVCLDGFITVGSNAADHDSVFDCLCPAGYQLAAAGANDSMQQTCLVCPDNTYQASPSLQPCQACPPGTVTLGPAPGDHNSSTSCTCMAGQYKVGGSCSTCPANTFKTTPGEAACVPCPAGTATYTTSNPVDHNSASDCHTVFKLIDSGGTFSCGVVTSNSSIACWGSMPDIAVPISQLAWKSVTVGGFHACGILANDTVRCWSKDSDKASPTDPNLKFSSISAGGYQTCGLLLENSTIRCYSNPSYIFSYAGYDTVGQYTQLVPALSAAAAEYLQASAG